MGFFEDLFQRKPGGTLVGNIFRQVSSQSTDGVLGQGANLMTWAEYDLLNMSDADYVAKYGAQKNGQIVAGVVPNPDIKTLYQKQQEIQTGQATASKNQSIGNVLKKYWWLALIPFGLIILAIVAGYKLSHNKKTVFNVSK